MTSWRDMNWDEDDSVILPEQRRLAIYENPAGNVVIRMERSWDEEDDSFVYVAPSNLRTLIDALTKCLPVQAPAGLITHQPTRSATTQGDLLRAAR